MSISLVKQIRDDRDPRLTAPLKFTLMIVATYHSEKHPETGTVVSNRRLADDLGVDIRTVQRHLNVLAALGKILIADTGHSKRRGKIFVLTPSDSSVASDPSPSDSSVVCQATAVSFANDSSVASKEQGSTDQGSTRSSKPFVPSGAEVTSEDQMPIYGSLDPSADMPEDGKASVPKEPFTRIPVRGTHKWLIYRFGQLQRQHHCGQFGFNQKPLHKTFRTLRDDGLTNEEIEILVQTFFARNEQYIRSQRDIDVALLFIAKVPALRRQASTQIEGLQRSLTGGQTREERRAERQAAMRRRNTGGEQADA